MDKDSEDVSPVPDSPLIRLLHACSGLVLLVWFFWSVIIGEQIFSYRDGAHWYPPLYRFVHSQMVLGQPPFWNSLENGGMPLVANPTAAFFYPLKVMFFLPFSDLHNYGLFVVTHVAICFFTMRHVCRRLGCSSGSACLGALAYAFSGNVLFQYCNVVFLIGAAWLPLALLSGQAAIYHRSIRRTVEHSLWLALIALGGDIQAAWMGGAAMAFYALILRLTKDRTASEPSVGFRQNRLVLVVFAAVVAGGAAAVQILPAMEFSGRSSRSVQMAPADIFHIPQHLLSGSKIPRPDTGKPAHWYDTLIGDPPPPIKHEAMAYAFPVQPWRLFEFLLPGIFGQRGGYWGSVFGIPINSWTYTLYAGLIPAVMSISGLQFRKRRQLPKAPLTADRIEKQSIQIWCSWLLLISLLGSFGEYTPLWALQKLIGVDWGGPLFNSVGGVYWAMRSFLPCFAAFRYPAKLMVIAAAAMAILCAFSVHQMEHRGVRRDFALLRKFGILAIIAVGVLAFFVWPHLTRWAGVMFGRHGETARLNFVLAIIQPLLVIFLLSWLRAFRRPSWVSLLLLLTVMDLGVAQRNLVETVSSAESQKPAKSAMVINDRHQLSGNVILPPRAYVVRYLGKVEGSVYEAQREFLEGQYFLDDNIARLGYSGTLIQNEQDVWFDYLPMPTDDGKPLMIMPRRALDAWGTQYFVIPTEPGDSHNPETSTLGLQTAWREPRWSEQDPQPIPAGGDLETVYADNLVTVLFNPSAMPRAWVVYDVRWIAPIDSRDRAQWLPLMEKIVFPLFEWIDLRKTAIVESADDQPAIPVIKEERHTPEKVEFTIYEPSRLELKVEMPDAGLLVIAEVFDDDWVLEVASDGGASKPAQLLQTNRTMRGVVLPAGSHRLLMQYKPRALYMGAIISIVTIGTLLGTWILFRMNHARKDGALQTVG